MTHHVELHGILPGPKRRPTLTRKHMAYMTREWWNIDRHRKWATARKANERTWKIGDSLQVRTDLFMTDIHGIRAEGREIVTIVRVTRTTVDVLTQRGEVMRSHIKQQHFRRSRVDRDGKRIEPKAVANCYRAFRVVDEER